MSTHHSLPTSPLKHTHRSRFALWLAPCLLLFLILPSFLYLTNIQTYAAAGHPCAPDPPPTSSTSAMPFSGNTGDLFINEILDNPSTIWNCNNTSTKPQQASDSWLELYNPTNQSWDLFAGRVQLSLDGGTNWYRFPYGSEIRSNSFLVIFFDDFPAFSIPLNIELYATTIIDQVSVGLLAPDQSYARIPDGSANWAVTSQPTIDASNILADAPLTPTSPKTVKPTATPTATKTPKPTVTPKSAKQTPSTRSTPSSSSSTPDPQLTTTVTGTQPAWSQLQLPATATSLARTSLTQSPSTTSQPVVTSSSPNPGLLFLLVGLALLLLATLFWGWKLFRSP